MNLRRWWRRHVWTYRREARWRKLRRDLWTWARVSAGLAVIVLAVVGAGALVNDGFQPTALGGGGVDSEPAPPAATTPTPPTDTPRASAPRSSTPTASESPQPSVDSDGDGLSNRAEQRGETAAGYPLPDATPWQKDLYLRLYVPANADPLTDQERADLERIWAKMPVSNPNGQDGVRLHVETVALNETLRSDFSNESLNQLRGRIYEGRVAGTAAACTVYAGVLAEAPDERVAIGRANSPGYFFIATDATERYGTRYTERTSTITHELLHNVAGRFENGDGHTSEGWLVGETDAYYGENAYLSDRTATKLSADGFETSEYYEYAYC